MRRKLALPSGEIARRRSRGSVSGGEGGGGGTSSISGRSPGGRGGFFPILGGGGGGGIRGIFGGIRGGGGGGDEGFAEPLLASAAVRSASSQISSIRSSSEAIPSATLTHEWGSAGSSIPDTPRTE